MARTIDPLGLTRCGSCGNAFSYDRLPSGRCRICGGRFDRGGTGGKSAFETQLRSGEPTQWPTAELQGRAKSYAASYARTAERAISRLRAEGWHLIECPGPRGGHGSAWWRAYPNTNVRD